MNNMAVNMNTFEFKCSNEDNTETTMKFNATTLDEILANFEMFLKGCGYQVNGVIDIVEDHYETYDEEQDLNIDYVKEVSTWFKSYGEPKDNIVIGESK